MSYYTIHLVDKIPGAGRRLLRFGDEKKRAIAERLNGYFQEVLSGMDRKPLASFNTGPPLVDELVVYFVADRGASLVTQRGGPLINDSEGSTWFSSDGMISEVYVGAIGTQSVVIANTAFHELMHNKLDAYPQNAVLGDIHTQGGGGLADTPVRANTRLSPGNIQLMRANIGLQIPQYWRP